MNRYITSALALSLLASCAHDDESDEPDEPCSPAHRTGVFWLTMTETDGDCGPVQPGLVNLSASDPGCTTLDQVLSTDMCTLDVTVECYDATFDYYVDERAVTTEVDPDTIVGTSYVLLSDEYGVLCESTYSIRAVRQ